MNVSHRKSSEVQLTFWAVDKPLHKSAQTRNVCGDFAEEATAVLVGGRRHRTDGTCDYCPDVSVGHPPRWFVESKSVGRTGHAIIYAHRLNKDVLFQADTRIPFCYAFWRHRVSACDFDTVSKLHDALALGLTDCVVLTLGEIERLTKNMSTRMLNYKAVTPVGKRNGYFKYGEGYSLTYRTLLAEATVTVERTIQCYERSVQVNLHCNPELFELCMR